MDLVVTAWAQGSEWFGLVASPFVGSFVATAVERSAENRTFLSGRSRCDGCDRTLAARDLVPMISWLALRGRCRRCGAPIGWQPLVVEALYLGVTIVAFLESSGLIFWIGCLLGWTLLSLALVDIKTFLLPDFLTLPLIAAGLAVGMLDGWDTVFDHTLAAGLGFGSLFIVATVYRVWTGREGLGMGDAKLFAATGAWLGMLALPGALLIAAATALLVEVIRRSILNRHSRLEPLAFGPYLALATWVGWIAGPLVPALS